MSQETLQKKALGLYRNKQILRFVESHKATTSEQLAAYLYRDQKQGKRIAQKKLYKLYKSKRLKRFASDVRGFYIYHMEKIQQWEHTIALNWVYLWLLRRLQVGEKITLWHSEKDYGILRCDALVGIANEANQTRYLFLELDRGEFYNKFDKVGKYNTLFEQQNNPKDFPVILVTTTEERRVEQIKQKIHSENRHNLKFLVKYLPDIIKEVWQ